MKSGIYMIKNISNKKVYVGQSINVYKRKHNHIYNLRSGNHHSKYLQNSFDKNGIDAFEFHILELCEENILNEREVFYISKYKSNNPKFGYNIQGGGYSRRDFYNKGTISDSSRKIISDKMKKYWKIRKEQGTDSELGKVIRLNDKKIFNHAKDAQDLTGINNTQIIECCRNIIKYASVDEFGLPIVWRFYDDWVLSGETYQDFLYENDVSKLKYHNRKVICVNDEKIFDNVNQASIEYCIKKDYVKNSCNRKSMFVENEDRTLLFLYSGDYYYNKITSSFVNFFITEKSIIHEQSNIIYSSFTEAEKYTGVNSKTISRCCNGKSKYAGKINGEKATWKFYNDYNGKVNDLIIPYNFQRG